jgi:hypothetical protein
MLKRMSLLINWVAVLTMAGSTLAQGPGPQHTDATWQATYWNNMTLSGTPVLQRDEADLDHDWGTGAPDSRVNPDGFSARWTRYAEFPAIPGGDYRFTVTSDDGVRVSIDGRLILEQWNDHSVQTLTADVNLGPGHHLIVVEYYEHFGDAIVKLSWAPITPVINNWRGEYFNNISLSGPAVLMRDDAAIEFDWGDDSPAPGLIRSDNFSVRWTRTLKLEAETYRFIVTADDGVRVWVNEHELISAWKDQPPRTYTGEIYLPGYPVLVKVEYYERTGGAVARLRWEKADHGQPGEVIVDDMDAGFVRGGLASSWRTAADGHGNHLIWTYNNDQIKPNYNWARWNPKLSPGRYEVYAFIPERYTTTSNARYWIVHANGQTLRVVNQSANSNQWVSLGTYRFNGTPGEYVALSDVTYELRLTRLVAFDAVKWVSR